MVESYCRPPSAPKIANSAKNNATGKIPITVHAVSLALLHSVFPCPVGFATEVFGQSIALDTSLKIKIPINSATAAPMKARMNPRLNIDLTELKGLFKKEEFVRNLALLVII
jgi:hypothetical protein